MWYNYFMNDFIFVNHPILLFVILTVVLWDIVWKALGLWRSARAGQTGWFVAMLILNTAGILPIIYLLLSEDISKKR